MGGSWQTRLAHLASAMGVSGFAASHLLIASLVDVAANKTRALLGLWTKPCAVILDELARLCIEKKAAYMRVIWNNWSNSHLLRRFFIFPTYSLIGE